MSQDYDDFEVVVVDDGSTDDSGKICDDYQNRFPDRIRVIHKDNQGLISARRIGINEASGDYCVFVDSDDYVSGDLLSSLSSFIEQKKVDIVLYLFTYFNNNGLQNKRKSLFNDGRIWTGDEKKELYELLATSSSIDALVIKAIKTPLLKEDSINYTLYFNKNMSEDTLQSIYPLTAAESVGYLDKSLYYYRYNPSSISRNYSIETLKNKDTLHVYNEIIKFLPVWELDTDDFRKRVNARWFDEAMYLFVKCYSSANSQGRKTILSFDWDSMIPCLDVESYKEYVSDFHLKLYNWYKNKNYFAIRQFFFRNKIYQKYKKIKSI